MIFKISSVIFAALSVFVLYADRLADYKPLEKKAHSSIVFAENFETRNNKNWILRPGYVFQRGEGVNATGGLSLIRPDTAAEYVFSKYNVTGFQPGREYRLSAMIKVQGLKHNGTTVPYTKVQLSGFDFFDDGKYLGSSYIPVAVKNGNSDWQEYNTVFTVPGKLREASLCFFLKKPYTCDRISWDDVKVEEVGEIIPVIYPVLPKKLQIKADGKVKMRVNSFSGVYPGGLKLFATLPGGREYSAPVHGNFAEFTFGAMAAGETTVKFSLVDVAKKRVIAEEVYPFFRVTAKPSAGSVDIDESGRVSIDGKPFFPLGFFIERPGELTTADMDKLSAIGVNTLLPYLSRTMRFPENRGKMGPAALRRSLDELQKRNLKVIFSLLEITGTIHIVNEYDGLTDKMAIARHIVAAVKDHPALLGWYISDENTPDTLDPVRNLRMELNRIDPRHPVATLSNTPRYFPWFGPTGDLMMIDKYPIMEKSKPLSMTEVRKCFEAEAQTLGLGAWWIPQCFNWGIYIPYQPYGDFRYPSEEDMRSQALLALNHRARAEIFYAYEAIRKQEACDPGSSKWFEPQLFAVIRLLKELEPFFLADDAPQTVKVIPAKDAPSLVEAKIHTAGKRAVVVITADGPGKAQAILKVGRAGLKSRFGRTKDLGNGDYEFTGMDIASDILE